MKSTLFAATTALLATAASAQYNISSAPFTLVVQSANETLDGSSLYACHEGAAIEGLCLSKSLNISNPVVSSTFYHNTSYYSQTPQNASLGLTGYLTYVLRGSNFNESEPMTLLANLGSNVAIPLFEPTSYGTYVAFDSDNKLNIQVGIDDTVSPPVYRNRALYRWWVCLTQAGYTYTTLAWVYGEGVPQNPTCQKVDVVRKFLPQTY